MDAAIADVPLGHPLSDWRLLGWCYWYVWWSLEGNPEAPFPTRRFDLIPAFYCSPTGVPDAQDDHAPRMAKFASSCQAKMALLVANVLTDKLGADTAELALRVGIDSGPITGGILRGDRGRFQ